MSQFWRASVVTSVGLFLEACAFYFAISVAAAAIQVTEAGLQIWLVFLALLSSYFLSIWVQSLPYTRGLRGMIGLATSVVFLLILSYLHTGPGLGSLNQLIDGDARTAVALTISLLFMITLWWRGATIAYEEISLESLRGSFRWGLVALFVAVVADAISSQHIISPYLAVVFFAVGLAGLSLARFSSAVSETQEMAAGWWLPIGVSVGGVILLALLIGALGMGGLDDFTGTTLRSIGNVGLWLLKPLLLVLGGLASVLVSLGNLISGWFGGGDLTSLELAQQRLSEFHEQLEAGRTGNGPPTILLGALKGLVFVVVFGVAAYILYRVFRFRRHLRRPGQVEETRESLFSWSRANRDLSDLLAGWWNSFSPVGGRRTARASEPANAREFYHRFLEVSERLGRPRWEWETPKQHESAMRALLPREPMASIIDAFQTSHYGGAETNQRELVRLRQDWAAINEFVAEGERRSRGEEGRG